METFLAITIHFIDENWKLQHLYWIYFSYTGESIANKVYSLLEEFKIETKVIAITTDNGSNLISAANFLQDKLILNDFCYYKCIAYILNLIVQTGLNLIENSTYQMVKKACLLYKSIEMLLVKYPNLKTYMPNKEEWKIYKNLIDLLELFNDATIELSSQTYSTIAHAQIILLAIRKDLESEKDENFLLHYVVDAMISKYIEYFHLITESLHISTFLDPRSNKCCFPNLDIEEILIPIRKKID
ncbi:4045_t:CDS:2 [Gigaspora rosea]|nr:4045_t:CDS:2 [Gigaspora rosea]